MIFLEQSASTERVSKSLNETAIKNRRRTNAISFFGQFCTWVAGILYILMALLFSIFAKTDHARELGAVFRLSQFFIIPLIEILTSPPLKRYISSYFKKH
jgi:hypothetical protein